MGSQTHGLARRIPKVGTTHNRGIPGLWHPEGQTLGLAVLYFCGAPVLSPVWHRKSTRSVNSPPTAVALLTGSRSGPWTPQRSAQETAIASDGTDCRLWQRFRGPMKLLSRPPSLLLLSPTPCDTPPHAWLVQPLPAYGAPCPLPAAS